MPFVSCKYRDGFDIILLCVENKGKMLFLLKEQSKPVSRLRKRIKRTVFDESLGMEVVSIEEKKHEEELGDKNERRPNIIDNKEALPGSNLSYQSIPTQINPNQTPPLSFQQSTLTQE